MLSMAFYQCYKTTHDLHYPFDLDFDRDVSFARGMMNGHYGQDPNYKGEFLWYNPMLFTIEAAIAKITSSPLMEVVVQAGTYLNLLGPITFFLMAAYFFGFEAALACLLCFLFSRGKMVNVGLPYNYSPWLYPFCFAQSLFYINIILCYKAFLSQKNSWFILLGITIGLSFLAHAAPTLLIILIMFSIQSKKIFSAIKERTYPVLKKYLLQGVTTLSFFILVSLPLLYYIVGKYHMHIVNRAPMEFTDRLFYMSHFDELVKENLSPSLIVALIGFIWFYKNFHQYLIRSIVLNWLFISIALYIYSTLVAFLGGERYNIHLPGTVPSFHYYFYIKTIEWLFFGFGFVFLFRSTIDWITNRMVNDKKQNRSTYINILFPVAVLSCAIIIFPSYKTRPDFVIMRDLSLAKEKNTDKIEIYNYILSNIPEDKVILCERKDSISMFPVMASSRKTVSIEDTFSNPYVDFSKRENDRYNMLMFLKTGAPVSAKKLFGEYDVSFVLLSASGLSEYKLMPAMLGQAVFRNKSFTIFKVNR